MSDPNPLPTLRGLSDATKAAQQKADHLREARDEAIRAAISDGARVARVAEATQLSRRLVRKIAADLIEQETPTMTTTTDTDKARENRLRRRAQRQGLVLRKSRSRHPQAYETGTYQLVDAATNTLAAWGGPSGFGMSLDDIEAALNEGDDQ